MMRGLLVCAAVALSLGCKDGTAPKLQVPITPGQMQGAGGPPPPVCDVPACGTQRSGLTAATGQRAAPTVLRQRSTSQSSAHVRDAFAAATPAAVALSAEIRRGLRGEDGPVTPEAAAWMARTLDDVAPGWRTLDASRDTPIVAEDHGLSTGRYALETSGCGDMALRVHLRGVTVIERDDNIANDKVYCIAQAEDQGGTEVLRTDVTRALDAGEYAAFSPDIVFGAEAPRDPGPELRLRYDCWEYDSAEDYERFRQAADVIRGIGKVFGGTVYAKAHSIAKIIDLITDIAAIFDGDDHLFQAEETLNRQAMWNWILDGEREVARGGNHNTSDWSWKLHIDADGCAGVFEAPPVNEPTCSAQTCDGCCVGGRCDDGRSEQACGRGGVACGSCGTGELCGSRGCAFDDRATFDVRVLYAELDDRCWDLPCGQPDPYIYVGAGGQRERTSLASNTYLPTWNEIVLNQVRASHLMDRLTFEVFDDDLRVDDAVGTCAASFSEADLVEPGAFVIDCGGAIIGFEIEPR